jgi:hypothetical protein
MSIVPNLKPPKHAKGSVKPSKWNQDNTNFNRLAQAKKAAMRDAPKMDSWWATPNLSREEFYARAAHRHRQILNGASDGTRSLTKVT